MGNNTSNLSSEIDRSPAGRLHHLLSSAAHIAGTGGSALLLGTPEHFEVVLRNGAPADLLEATAELVLQLFNPELFNTHLSTGPAKHVALPVAFPAALPVARPIAFMAELRRSSPDLQFFASVPIVQGSTTVGVLIVCDVHPGVLNAAQEYVLRTLASEVADQLEFQRLRRTATERDILRSTRDERLRLLESVVVNANDAVLITEAEPISLPGPRIVYANAAFTRTTGYALEEILGKTPRILHGPLTDHVQLERVKTALREWKPVEVELLNYRKDGSIFWVELSIVPVADETGWFTHWVSVQRDVTDRKANEEAAIRLRLAEANNLALASEVKQRMRSEAQLAFTAFHDHLTGLRNRAYFLDRLHLAIEHLRSRPHGGCAVIFLDLDNFKAVNDRFGHSVGDSMLVEVAHRLQRAARPQDTVSRMGGDEFTVLLDDIPDVSAAVSVAVAVAGQMLDALKTPIRLMGVEVVMAASIGISVGNARDLEHILRNADTAMYRAKSDGGSGFAVFEEEMHDQAMAALHLRLELEAAVDEGQFELHYQPMVNTRTRKICGVEALVRWNHPARGMVFPLHFIGIAEETGLIVKLGSWVLHEACRHLALWHKLIALEPASPAPSFLDPSFPAAFFPDPTFPDPSFQDPSFPDPASSAPNFPAPSSHARPFLESTFVRPPFKLCVNVSTRQLEDPGFYADLQTALRETGIPPHTLELEITESVFLQNRERMGTLLAAIRALGVQIACDDFGTGYSSLSYLERYPIDTIKIDQSFVQRLLTGHVTANIVRMIVGLARALEMDVTAEGVENMAQQDALQRYGCTVVQGYLFSQPVPFIAMTELLTHGVPAASAVPAPTQPWSTPTPPAASAVRAPAEPLSAPTTSALPPHAVPAPPERMEVVA